MSSQVEPRVVVIGAGVMGAAIAQVFASAGVPTSIYDVQSAAMASAPERILAGLRLLDIEPEDSFKNLSFCLSLEEAVEGATLVIEAASEKLAVKQAIFADLDRLVGPETVLASNTSAIPISQIAVGVSQPGRVVGTHFWNPPYLVPLVEVVQASASDINVVLSTIDLLRKVGLRPVHVRSDVAGFVGNRLQHALKREAIALVAEGVCDARTVDEVTRYSFGARLGAVGPLEQADLSGLNLTLAIHEVVMPVLDRTPVPLPYLVDLVARGETGAAVGKGFITWEPGEADRRRNEIQQEILAWRKRYALASNNQNPESETGETK